jgi:hypothetical protein
MARDNPDKLVVDYERSAAVSNAPRTFDGHGEVPLPTTLQGLINSPPIRTMPIRRFE